MHDLRCVRVAGIHAMYAEIRPHRGEATEGFASGETIPAIHPFRFRGGQEEGHIITGFGMSGGEHLPIDGALEYPLKRGITGTPQVGCHACPV